MGHTDTELLVLTDEDKLRLKIISGMIEEYPQLKEPLRKLLNGENNFNISSK